MKEDCVFCRIARNELPAQKIWEDENHLAFLSIFPNTDGFTVVIPKKHYSSYAFDVQETILVELILATKKVARLLDAAFEDVGRTGMFFEGFGVDHLHAKLFPMHGTANMEKWKPIESKQKTFFKIYPGYLSSHDADRANDKHLKDIAEKIKSTTKRLFR